MFCIVSGMAINNAPALNGKHRRQYRLHHATEQRPYDRCKGWADVTLSAGKLGVRSRNGLKFTCDAAFYPEPVPNVRTAMPLKARVAEPTTGQTRRCAWTCIHDECGLLLRYIRQHIASHRNANSNVLVRGWPSGSSVPNIAAGSLSVF